MKRQSFNEGVPDDAIIEDARFPSTSFNRPTIGDTMMTWGHESGQG